MVAELTRPAPEEVAESHDDPILGQDLELVTTFDGLKAMIDRQSSMCDMERPMTSNEQDGINKTNWSLLDIPDRFTCAAGPNPSDYRECRDDIDMGNDDVNNTTGSHHVMDNNITSREIQNDGLSMLPVQVGDDEGKFVNHQHYHRHNQSASIDMAGNVAHFNHPTWRNADATAYETMRDYFTPAEADREGRDDSGNSGPESDMLDYVFDGVEGIVCKEGKTTQDIMRNNSLADDERLLHDQERPPPDALDRVFDKMEKACKAGGNEKNFLDVARNNSLLTESSAGSAEEPMETARIDDGAIDSFEVVRVDRTQRHNTSPTKTTPAPKQEQKIPWHRSERAFRCMWILICLLASGLVTVGVMLILRGLENDTVVQPVLGEPSEKDPPTTTPTLTPTMTPTIATTAKTGVHMDDACREAVMLTDIGAEAAVVRNQIKAVADLQRSYLPTCGEIKIDGDGIWAKLAGYNLAGAYRIVGDGKMYMASTCSEETDFDTQVAIFSGSCGSLSCIGGNDDYCDKQSKWTWFAEPGIEYYIFVHVFNSNTGTLELTVKPVIVQENDQCQGSSTVRSSAVLGSTKGVGTELDEVIHTCENTTDAARSGMWYTWIGTGRIVEFSTCNNGTDYDAEIAIFSGDSCDDLRCVSEFAASEDCAGMGHNVQFESDVLTEYRVLVQAGIRGQGDFELTITELDVQKPQEAEIVKPSNDTESKTVTSTTSFVEDSGTIKNATQTQGNVTAYNATYKG